MKVIELHVHVPVLQYILDKLFKIMISNVSYHVYPTTPLLGCNFCVQLTCRHNPVIFVVYMIIAELNLDTMDLEQQTEAVFCRNCLITQ